MSEYIFFGDEVKALDDNGLVGGYAVRHKDEAHKDFVGDFFDAETYLGAREGDGCDTLFHHGKPIKKGLEAFADHIFAPMKTKRDAIGLFAQSVLDLSDAYEKTVFDLIKAGKISFSTGAPGHMVKREANGHLKRWPVAEISYTPTPCDFENKVYNLKSIGELEYVAIGDIKPELPSPSPDVPALKQILIPKDLVSESLESHSQAVVSAVAEFAHTSDALTKSVKEWAARVKDKQEFRASDPLKAGRVLSQANRDAVAEVMAKLEELMPVLKDMHGQLTSLHAMAEPKPKSVDEDLTRGLLANFEMLQRRMSAARR